MNDRQTSDFYWFLSFREEFVRAHHRQWVVISNKTIVGYYDSYHTAYRDAIERGYRCENFIMEPCIREGEEVPWEPAQVWTPEEYLAWEKKYTRR